MTSIDQSETASTFPLSIAFRIAAILLGIASVTLMAQKAFGFSFNNDFLTALKLVENSVGALVLPFELIVVKPALIWLRENGWTFQLSDHWKNAFVLLWLFNASQLRAFVPPSDMRMGVGEALRISARWVWAAIAALAGSIAAGTVALDDPALFWWAIGAFFLFRAGNNFIDGAAYISLRLRSDDEDRLWVGEMISAEWTRALVWLALAAVSVLLALFPAPLPAISGHPATFWWPAAAFFFLRATEDAIEEVSRGRRPIYFSSVERAQAAFAVAMALLAVGVIPSPTWLVFEGSPSPGLANLAAFVVVIAISYLMLTMLFPGWGRSFLSGWLKSAAARVGLDILTVLGSATIIVYVAHSLG